MSGCCAMHPSGNGTSNGLGIHTNIVDNKEYLWTHTVVG
jgi:hypothetical protein